VHRVKPADVDDLREFDERLSRRARKANVPLTLDIVERLEGITGCLRAGTPSQPDRSSTERVHRSAVDRLLIEPLAAAALSSTPLCLVRSGIRPISQRL
jgi:hypothetical protein